MNRYQAEVAEMDRRHRVWVRTVTFVGTAALIALCLWSIGMSPIQGWWGDSSSKQVADGTARPPKDGVRPLALLATEHHAHSQASVTPMLQQLYLVATTPGRNKHEGTARIGTAPDNPQTYVAGALLVNGARVAEIHRDHVVLERDGNQVELYLYALTAQRRPQLDELILASAPPAPRLPPMTREVLTDYLRPSPVFHGEDLRGYEVYPGRKGGVFSQLGLRPGDVITAINGAPVFDASSAISALKELANGTIVVVNIERGGKSDQLVLDGSLITDDLAREQNAAAARPLADSAGA